MKKRIAVLLHEKTKSQNLRRYLINYLADIWRSDGNEIVFLFGVKKFIPADLVIVHVDVSVVPDEYLEFAKRYPIVLNGGIRDIRKSAFSRNLLGIDDAYDGKVIVKSDLNAGGRPERLLKRSWPPWISKLSKSLQRVDKRASLQIRHAMQYRVYDHLSDVPRAYFGMKSIVVEKFLPEMQDDLYFVRLFQFLGNKISCTRLGSRHPVAKDETYVTREIIEPHPEVVKLRKQLKFDYGKFDYGLHDGNVVVFDINKTTGLSQFNPRELEPTRYHIAGGIYSYFE